MRNPGVPCIGRCDHAPAAVVGRNPVDRATAGAIAEAVAAGHTEPDLPPHLDLAAYRAGGSYRLLQECMRGERAVDAVVAAPLGAHPTACSPAYGIDLDHLKVYGAATTPEVWADYRARFVDVTDEAFWTASLDVVRSRIDDYQAIAASTALPPLASMASPACAASG